MKIIKGYWLWGLFSSVDKVFLNEIKAKVQSKLKSPFFETHITLTGPYLNIDNIFGNTGDDTINGGADADIISGGGGNDTIYGGSGDDQIKGGGGRDTFQIGIGDGRDLITDYKSGTDSIELLGDLTENNLTFSYADGNTSITYNDDLLAIVENITGASDITFI